METKMKKKIVFALMFFCVLVSYAHQTRIVIANDQSPKYTVNFGYVNPKFVFKDISTDSWEEVSKYNYQLPNKILSGLTIEDLFKYSINNHLYVATNGSLLCFEFDKFNGFQELSKRIGFPSNLVNLMTQYYDNKKYDTMLELIFFIGNYNIFPKLSESEKLTVLQVLYTFITSEELMRQVPEESITTVNSNTFFMVAAHYLHRYYSTKGSANAMSPLSVLNEEPEKIIERLQNVLKLEKEK